MRSPYCLLKRCDTCTDESVRWCAAMLRGRRVRRLAAQADDQLGRARARSMRSAPLARLPAAASKRSAHAM
jgi:hypothetical protein